MELNSRPVGAYCWHLILCLVAQISQFLSTIYWTLQGQISSKNIQKSIDGLPKIPQHLVVVLVEEESLEKISQVLSWCAISGIKFVSICDVQGNLKKKQLQALLETSPLLLRHNIECTSSRSSQLWFQLELAEQKQQFCVNFISQMDGRSDIVDCVRRWANTNQTNDKPQAFSAIILQNQLKDFKDLPEPNLVLKFEHGGVMPGLSPWHISLTEFLTMGPLKKVSWPHFLGALKWYSRSVQRFGR
jgi:undecaprenyl pyrophosphate synthase